jgi:CheY-like chemotaxis protein
MFRVIDSGIGISDEKKSSLFREFYQSESSITRKYGGTGLGLAISRNLVSLMNGEINVISELGIGSEFWFRLPLYKAEVTVEDLDENQENLPKDIKILLAEDNVINQKVSALSLRHLGYECDIANNGKEAVDMYKKTPYDLILMDMQMPELNGVEATIEIRAYEENSWNSNLAYITAVTANSMVEDKKDCILAGMDAFLTKPFVESDLTSILYEVAKRTRKKNLTEHESGI